MNKKISVIIPTYNCEKYIEKCLNSVINQTYKNLEIICSDDGSVDNTKAILQKYQTVDSRIIIKDNPGGYIGGNRNNGLKYATGEFVAFVDCDDWLEPDVYEKAIAAYKNHPDVEIVLWQADERDESNNVTPRKYYYYSYSGLINFDINKVFSVADVPWNKMYKKSIIDKYNILFPENTYCEDTAFWWKYTMVISKAYFLKEILYHKLSGEDNTTKTEQYKKRELESRLNVIMDICNFYKLNNFDKKHFTYLMYFICFLAVKLRYTTDADKKRDFWDKISDYIKTETNLEKFNHPFIKNILDKRYDKIPEFGINHFRDKIFSYKKGIRKSVLCLFGIKITKKLD